MLQKDSICDKGFRSYPRSRKKPLNVSQWREWNSNNVSTQSYALAYIWPGCSALYPWLGSPLLFPEFLSCSFSPQSPCGQSQEAGIRDLFSHLYSELIILFNTCPWKSVSCVLALHSGVGPTSLGTNSS